MRQNRAVMSVWVYEQTCPMCSAPLTVGGGVSIEYTSARVFERSNRNVAAASHREAHFSSSPSRLGFSGMCAPAMVDDEISGAGCPLLRRFERSVCGIAH